MPRIHTHYDNLKVSRDAPAEVIRASYRVLAQKHHPDKHGGDSEALRITAAINKAYEVLSDPLLRKQHDKWITEAELSEATPSQDNASNSGRPARNPAAAKAGVNANTSSGGLVAHVTRYWYAYGFALFASLVVQCSSESTDGASDQQQLSETETEDWSTRSLAPDGRPWPATASYIRGEEILSNDGLSSVTVDNSRLSSDVFGKLVSLDNSLLEGLGIGVTVRSFYIPAGGSFRLDSVTPGNYDVRYRDLSTGNLSRSEPFNLTERDVSGGTEFSNITMTLYQVRDGNMRTFKISEREF